MQLSGKRPLLPSFQVIRTAPGYFLREFLGNLPFINPGWSLALILLVLLSALAATGFAAWKAIQKWGESSRVNSNEMALNQSGQLQSIWYSPEGDLYGYRQEDWKVTLLRWRAQGGSVPDQVQLNLDELTPGRNGAKGYSAPINSERKVAAIPNARTPQSPIQTQQHPNKGATGALTNSGPSMSLERLTLIPLVAVSENLLGVAWAWDGKLYWTVLGDQPQQKVHPAVYIVPPSRVQSSARPAEKSANPSRRVIPYNLPAGMTSVVGISFAGPTELLLQDDSSQRLVFYDLREGKAIRSFSIPAPCPMDVVAPRALVACALSPGIMILDFSKSSEILQVDLPVPSNQIRTLGLTALGLSRGGTAAVGADMGNVLFWPADKSGKNHLQVLRSPGVAQTLECDENVVLVGGGFRGIYALEDGVAPRLLVNDITGTTLLAMRNLDWSGGNFIGGSLAFGTREGVSVARLTEIRGFNNLGYLIVVAWVSFWALYFIGIPLLTVALQEIQREREVRVRSELGRSFEQVAPGGSSESAGMLKLADPPEKLISVCAAGECVAFVGAGLGAQAGLPTWQPMLQALLTEVSQQNLIDPKQAESLQAALNEGQWNVVADELVDKLAGRSDILQNFMVRTYLRKDLRPTTAHHLLRSLNLSGLLSTSFDGLLETTFENQVRTVYTHQDAGTLLEQLTRKQFFFAKLYGSLQKPGTLLIGRSQFEEAMARNPLLSRFVESLFYSRTLFFIGAGFDGIESYLAGLKIAGTSELRHFALVAAHGGAWRAKADLLRRRYGIQVLAFSPEAGFSEVEQFLGTLASAVSSRLANSAQGGPGKIARLKSVTLKNIGPFDDMTLDLDTHWTVLLGDNGVGKSTVLRAIAVGLAGSEAGESAGRLISVGKESIGGSIVLRTDAGTEYTTLITKGDRTIVQSQGSRPLEVERWLALGFPPLRTFTLTPVGDLPPRGLQRLTSSDLTPLITGELDPRPDKLKAWLVDLDYQDKDQRASNQRSWSFLRKGDAPTQFTTLIEQFFRVIRELTPGLRLGKVEIDPAKKEVHVETDDGVLRIEMVSQGTQSLLGWVGILMQRLNDFYSRRPSDLPSGTRGPAQSLLEQHALVLMDEIDAHMHPKWQHQVVHTLKGLFPNVQFIATTHSPLIVAGMERREVRVARRAGTDERNAGRVILEPPRQKLKGMRADQILTATNLFNMDSTLTPDIDASRQRYTVLAAKDRRSPEEQAELDKIAENLEILAPAPHESEVARLAFDKMQVAFEAQLGDLSPEQRQKVIEEAKVQIQENITGSRRP